MSGCIIVFRVKKLSDFQTPLKRKCFRTANLTGLMSNESQMSMLNEYECQNVCCCVLYLVDVKYLKQDIE